MNPPSESLFGSSERPVPRNCIVATIDGAARGNPGPAAYAVVFEDARGKVLTQLAGRLGRTTNNVAEYRALLAAVAYARQQGWRALKVRTDSELLARQLRGEYRVRSADLKPLHDEARQLIATLDYFGVEAVSRKLIRPADKLANAALDRRPASAKATAGRPATGLSRSLRATSRGAESRSGRRPAKTKLSPVAPATGTGVVRAVYQGGVLKPKESLDLADGEEVELTIRRRPTK